MLQDQYDVVVIGSGPAGEKAALEAAALGAKTLIIERWGAPGGAGTLSGTLPSKSLRETVQYVDSLTHDEINGIASELGRPLTIKELMHRKNRVIDQRVDSIYRAYEGAGVTFISGAGKLVGTHQVAITPRPSHGPSQVTAKSIIIAVGTSPYHPPDIDFDHFRILDSDKILNLEEMPKSLIVYGAGVIGSEYASIFAKLGCSVTIVEPRGKLMDFLDADLSVSVARAFMNHGVALKLGRHYKAIEGSADQVLLRLENGEEVRGDYLLYANGRQGQAEGMGLEAQGIELNHRKQLSVNENYQTKLPHIYAVGDIIGLPSLVSISNEEGRMAARHAILGEPGHRITGHFPCAIYTIPEVSMMGPTEQELEADGVDYVVGRAFFGELARGLIMGVHEGMIKLIFERSSRKLLAVHLFGEGASELVHIGQAVMCFGGKLDYFTDEIFNFPSLASGYKVAAHNALQHF
ncbi:MAG: Si-specific NAD(P)(+) transhydrogenase [bacterium]|nr:Si-specific NAD(P)(+) transhydrogenase [bacterium]